MFCLELLDVQHSYRIYPQLEPQGVFITQNDTRLVHCKDAAEQIRERLGDKFSNMVVIIRHGAACSGKAAYEGIEGQHF